MDTSSKDKVPFVIQLIDELKRQEFISSGIMLPLLIGAYKIKEDYEGEDYLEFTKYVYSDVIESLCISEQRLFFRACEASHNFIIEPVSTKPQQCNAVIVHRGVPIIYCNDPLLENDSIKDANDMLEYFLNKLLAQTVKYCNYIDTCPDAADYKEWMCRLNDDEAKTSEKNIIKFLIQK